jgi:hypothetical protein
VSVVPPLPRCVSAGRAALVLSGAALLGSVLLGTAGCSGMEEASAAGATRGDLVSALTDQLTTGSTVSYTATYQLAGGKTATIVQAQSPLRTAYSYPGGRLIVTPTATIRCKGDDTTPTCAETAPDATAAASLAGTSLVTPEAALAMLNAATLDPDAVSRQHDTTIAGRHATCLDLSGVDGTPAREFGICVTNDGALASFTATIDGEHTDLALTTYSDQPTPSAFALPPAAELTDNRTK